MAIWQYYIYLAPRQIIDNELAYSIDKDVIEDRFIELEYGFNSFKWLKDYFKKGESWHSDLLLYGKLDSNCIAISLENRVIYSIEFRLDFCSDNCRLFLEWIVNNASIKGYCLFDDFSILPLNVAAIEQKIRDSEQFNSFLWQS